MGYVGEGGKGFMQGGVGGRAKFDDIVGGFGGGGGSYGWAVEITIMTPVEVEEALTMLEKIRKMNVVTIRLAMVR